MILKYNKEELIKFLSNFKSAKDTLMPIILKGLADKKPRSLCVNYKPVKQSSNLPYIINVESSWFLLFYKKENNVDIFVLDFSEYK